MTARERWKADLDRYVAYSHDPGAPFRRLRIILTTEGVWALWMYRFGQYLLQEAPPPVRILLRIPYEIIRRIVALAVGIHLDPATYIGPGFYIAHCGGIWINPRVTIGSNCNIAHGVTLGAPLAARNAPVIGDRVWIGSGAIVTGPVRIGSGVVIGANSLVTCSLPDNAVAVGVPARVLVYSGSANLIRLAGDVTHPPRT